MLYTLLHPNFSVWKAEVDLLSWLPGASGGCLTLLFEHHMLHAGFLSSAHKVANLWKLPCLGLCYLLNQCFDEGLQDSFSLNPEEMVCFLLWICSVGPTALQMLYLGCHLLEPLVLRSAISLTSVTHVYYVFTSAGEMNPLLLVNAADLLRECDHWLKLSCLVADGSIIFCVIFECVTGGSTKDAKVHRFEKVGR